MLDPGTLVDGFFCTTAAVILQEIWQRTGPLHVCGGDTNREMGGDNIVSTEQALKVRPKQLSPCFQRFAILWKYRDDFVEAGTAGRPFVWRVSLFLWTWVFVFLQQLPGTF